MIHLPATSPVSYCGFAVRAGSRDENNDEYGLAHFTEHLLFKGTAKRKSWHIINRMENVGGELNAYTSKEETLVYSIFMEEHFDRAAELLADITFHSRFPSNEIEKEVDVILDEINTYNDTPSDLIFDEFENIVFAGHSLGHSILGEERTLQTFTTSSGLNFTGRFYTPRNMIFFSMSRMKPERIVRILERYIGDIPAGSDDAAQRIRPSLSDRVVTKVNRNTHQTHVVIGGRSYDMFAPDEKRLPLYLLNNLLGGPGMNSRLNISLREKHGLVYNVESGATAFTDCGLATIYFGSDPKNTDKAIKLVQTELSRLRECPLTPSQLAALKKQVSGQIGVAVDNREGLILGAGKRFLYHNSYESADEVVAKLQSVTADDIQKAACEIYNPDSLSCLLFA
jgi:predicted Zn-dependent peptidase